MKSWVCILNVKSVYKELKGAGTVVAGVLHVGFPSYGVSVCQDGCLIVEEENAVWFFIGFERWATETKAGREAQLRNYSKWN